MSRRFALLLVGGILLLAAAAVVWQLSRGRHATSAAPNAPAPAGGVATTATPFKLYFPGRGGLLYAEPRDLEVTAVPRDRVEAIVRAVLAGPKSEGLVAPLPPGIQPALVMLGADGTAFVDLHAPNNGAPPPSGSMREMQTVYSLVDSIALNVPEARRVVLLWNGVQPITFAGHLATDRPIRPSTELLAAQ